MNNIKGVLVKFSNKEKYFTASQITAIDHTHISILLPIEEMLELQKISNISFNYDYDICSAKIKFEEFTIDVKNS